MAERIDDIISPKAFEQVQNMDKALTDLVKKFEGNVVAIKAINAALSGGQSIKQVTDNIKIAATETAKLEAAQRRLEFANSESGKELAALNYQISEAARLNRAAAKEMLSAEGSSAKLSAQLIRLRTQFDNMSESLRKSPMGQELAKRINLVDTALKTLDSNTGRFQRNVGNYATATNSLSQVLREMPAFTYSAQTGILALSNNLPILADQFKVVRAETGSTAAALKIFGASLFSFGNIFTIAIGLVTVFWDKIAGIAKSTKEATNSIDEFNQSISASAGEITVLHNLYAAATDVTMSMEKRKQAVNELQQLYPAYFANLKDEEILIGNAARAYDELVNSLMNAAIFKAFEKNMEPQFALLAKQLERLNTLVKEKDSFFGLTSDQANRTRDLSKRQENYNKAIEEQKNIIDATKKSIREQYDAAKNYFTLLKKENSISRPSSARSAISDRAKSGTTESDSFDFEEQFRQLNLLYNQINSMNEKADDEMRSRVRKAAEERFEHNKRAAQQEIDLIKEWDRAYEEHFDKLEKEEREAYEKRVRNLETYAQLAQGAANIVGTIAAMQYDNEIALIEKRSKALEESYNKELKALELSGKSKAEIEKEKQRLEAVTEAQRKKIDQDRISAARKKARADKMADIANIISGTAVATVNALGAKPYTPANIALAAITAAIGAANLARAIAAPLPQYAKGTDSAKGGDSIVGEKGVELVQEPGGRTYLTPNKPTIMNLKRGSKVIPNHELMQHIKYAAMVRLSGEKNITEASYGAALIETMQDHKNETIRLRKVLEQKELQVTIQNNAMFDHWINSHIRN